MRAFVLAAVMVAVCLPRARAQDEEPRGFFGVGISDLGCLVHINDVYGNTAAARAGVEPGDVILAIDGLVPGSTQGMIARVGGMKPGTRVHFRLLRGDQVFDVRTALGNRIEDVAPSGRTVNQAIAKRIAAIQELAEGNHFEHVYGWCVAALQEEQRDEARALSALCRELARAEVAGAARGTSLRHCARWMHRAVQSTWLHRLAGFERPVPLNHGRSDLSDEAIAQRIRGLVAQLGDPSYACRDRASRELIRIGAPAIPTLPAAMASTDREVAWRARWLKQAIEDGLAIPVHAWQPVVIQVVAVESGGTIAARLEMGAPLVPGAHYRAMTWASASALGAEVVFTLAAPVHVAHELKRLRLVAGVTPAVGTRLVYLAPMPAAAR